MQTISNYIAGEARPPVSGAYLDNTDPAIGAAYSRVPDSDERDVNAAIDAAAGAFPAWSRTAAEVRSQFLLRIADFIEADVERFALAECVDTGKPLKLARNMDIPRSVKNFRFFATAILHERTDAHVTDHTALNYTLRRPRGVAGLISPWNLPLYLLSWKIAPALATGNTAVAKPSEVTPMTAHLLAEVCRKAELPAGVLNIVHGLGPKVGAPLITHPRVPTISFTGGTATGRAIATAAAPLFKKLALEMGGKNPTVVFADADFEDAVATSVRAAFSNQGQICLCGSRILVEASIYERFVAEFVARTKQLRIGDPLDETSDLGSIVSQPHLEKVRSYIELAKQEGGRILCGGGPPASTALTARCRNGYFLEPTVITGLGPNCRTNLEEIFGPVVTILPFRDEEQALAIANGTEYGLAASLWTTNLNRAHRVAEGLQSGTIWVNCWLLRDLRVPFGGMKNSGVGREGGDEAIRFFTEPKNVCLKL